MRWEHLRISVYREGDDKVDFVAKRDKELPSFATHEAMQAHFNVTQDEWDAYLQKLRVEGWQLVNVDMRKERREESYHFKRHKD